MEPRKSWMDQPAPANYIAGLGRGATGFTTRSDIGPARMGPDPVPIKDMDDDRGDYSESNYDEFEGYGGSFVDPASVYDQEDREADEIWDAVERRMDSKRKERREKRAELEMQKFRATRPKLQAQFADLKRSLGELSQEEWASLPEIGDQTKRFRKKAKTNLGYMPVPDSVLAQAKASTEYNHSLDKVEGFETPMGPPGGATPLPGDATPMSQRAVSEARQNLLNLKLKSMSDSVSGQTVVDPKGYLTGLGSVKVSSEAEIGDIKKARLLLKSVVLTNPSHGPGWIAAARLEEVAGKLSAARKVILQGTDHCPTAPDVWVEAARLHGREEGKAILAKAVQHCPTAPKLWLQAAALEEEGAVRQRVLRRGLEVLPQSVQLWKAAIEGEPPAGARLLLSRAVECVPHRVEMWLALAHLETYANARKVLNKAREALPTEPAVWLAAAHLEEAQGHREVVGKIIPRAFQSLAAHHVTRSHEEWLKEAAQSEAQGAVATAQAIVKEALPLGVEPADRKRVWVADAEAALAAGAIETARAIYAEALRVFPTKKSLWLRVAQLERAHGTPEALDGVLQKAVEECPTAEILWLMAAKELWLRGDIAAARETLHRAFAANPNSEEIWLAAVKLESESHEVQRARALLLRARERAGTERVWLKSALLEREVGNDQAEQQLLDEALQKFPQFPKFWIMRAQLSQRRGEVEEARTFYQRGMTNCPTSALLWEQAALLEEKEAPSRARSLLEKARLKNPKQPELWLASVGVERRAGNVKVSHTLMAKALQECPTAGILWAEAIDLDPPAQKKSRSVEALKRCDQDPFVLLAVAKLFWADRKMDKALTWFNRALRLNPDHGDAWAVYLRFLQSHGTEEDRVTARNKCKEAAPRHGRLWTKVSKALGNEHLSTEQILDKVIQLVEPPS